MECKKCGGTNYYKSGFIKGHQRYKCKECDYKSFRAVLLCRIIERKKYILE